MSTSGPGRGTCLSYDSPRQKGTGGGEREELASLGGPRTRERVSASSPKTTRGGRWSLFAVGAAVPWLLAGCTAAASPALPIRLAGTVSEPTVRAEPVPEPAEPAAPEAPSSAPETIVVVTLDGIRWQEVFRGVDPTLVVPGTSGPVQNARALVPNLHHLMHHEGAVLGAPGHGAPLSASGPAFISMPGYLELLQGRAAPDCWSNTCPFPDLPTLLDDFAAGSGARLGEVALFASWPELSRVAARDRSRVLVSAGAVDGSNLELLRSDPGLARLLDEGAKTGQQFARGDYRPDASTAELALAYLAWAKPRFLFVSLGDADEHGHAGRYDRYLEALHESDRFVGHVLEALKKLEAAGRTTLLIVTTDHGRDAAAVGHGPAIPASARAWLVARGRGIHGRGLVASPEPRHLVDVAATLRAIGELPPDRGDGAGKLLTELVGETPPP